MTEFSKSRYEVDILPLTILEFLEQIQNYNKVIEILEGVKCD